MSITPTPHLFRALSAADIARPAAPANVRAQQAFANIGAIAGGTAPANPARPPQPPGQAEKTKADHQPQPEQMTASTKTPESGGGEDPGGAPTVAANHRREAVGPTRPQQRPPGTYVDIRV